MKLLQKALKDFADGNELDKCQIDNWVNNKVDIAAGISDSMLPPTIIFEGYEKGSTHVTPGSRPLSIFSDEYFEEFAYPGNCLAHERPD